MSKPLVLKAATADRIVISNYVQLCIAERLKPGDAYKEMKRKMRAIKELRNL